MATELSKHQSVMLEKLVMSGVDMGAGDFPWDLVHGNWPALKHVDLSSNCLTDRYAHVLSQAN